MTPSPSPSAPHTSSALEGPSTTLAQVGNEEWVCVACEVSKGFVGPSVDQPEHSVSIPLPGPHAVFASFFLKMDTFLFLFKP